MKPFRDRTITLEGRRWISVRDMAGRGVIAWSVPEERIKAIPLRKLRQLRDALIALVVRLEEERGGK